MMELDVITTKKSKGNNQSTDKFRLSKSDIENQVNLCKIFLNSDSIKKSIKKEDVNLINSLVGYLHEYQNSEDGLIRLKSTSSLILEIISYVKPDSVLSFNILNLLSSACLERLNISERCAFEYVHDSIFCWMNNYSKHSEDKDSNIYYLINNVLSNVIDLYICLSSNLEYSSVNNIEKSNSNKAYIK